jgi:hypothetical protein
MLPLAASPAKAAVTFSGPATEGGACEGANETKVFLNEGHSESSGSGTVRNGQNAPVLLFSVDSGALDTRVDTGGGFANITSANADKLPDFNGIDITIPGFTFTDIIFDVQLNPTEANNVDSFSAQGFSGAHVSDGTAFGIDTPNDDKQFALNAVGGAFDEVNLLSADGFKEIKQIEISGLARVVGSAVPEPSTWAMMGLGFGLMGLVGYRRTRSALA